MDESLQGAPVGHLRFERLGLPLLCLEKLRWSLGCIVTSR